MNAIQTWTAVIAVIGTTVTHAAIYNVSGTQSSVYGYMPIPITATSFPAAPTFAGIWDVTTSSLAGDIYFEDYDLLFDPLFSVEYSEAGYVIVGGILSYNAATRTLALTDASAMHTGIAPACLGSMLICYAFDSDIEDLDLTLTFSSMFDLFTGTIIAVNNGGIYGTSTQTWIFDGVEQVPLPAAAWLLGSSLFGVAAARISLRKRQWRSSLGRL